MAGDHLHSNLKTSEHLEASFQSHLKLQIFKKKKKKKKKKLLYLTLVMQQILSKRKKNLNF